MFPKQTYPTTNNHSFSVIKIDSACIDNKHETTSTKIFKGIVEVKIAADQITQIELNLLIWHLSLNNSIGFQICHFQAYSQYSIYKQKNN